MYVLVCLLCVNQVTMQLKDGMTQEVTGNPNTNTVQFHVQEANQETWMINDYNSVSVISDSCVLK